MRYKIIQDGETVNTIVASEAFATEYCTANGYTYEEDPLPEPAPPPLDERVTALENTKADQTDVDELNEALNMILTGYTGEEAADETGA